MTSFSLPKDDPIAAKINLERNKGSYQMLNDDQAYFLVTNKESNPIDAIINLKRKTSVLNERLKSDRTYVQLVTKCFN